MNSKILPSIVLIALAICILPQAAFPFYNPSTGRWLSRDPLGEKGGLNEYAFVANDPLRKADILGKFPNPFSPDPGPPNQIHDPPTGPFSKCRTALKCGPAFSGVIHCGLVIDTGGSVYGLDGSGGTFNWLYLTPGSSNDATGQWTDNPTSVCDCLFANIKSWNSMNVPRDNLCANSNWNLKCSAKKCKVQLNWGGQAQPLGYNCRECQIGGDPTLSAASCCAPREKPCPGE